MFTHTNVYIPYFLRSTPRYLKTFEKMGLRDLHLACVDFWPILQTVMHFFFIYKKIFDRILAGMYTFECVHSIIPPPPSLSVKFAKNPHKPNASHAKPFFSKVFRYLGVDLKKKTSLIE